MFFIVTLMIFSKSSFSDEFYVAYNWNNGGDAIVSWATGNVNADIDTADGIIKLINLIEEKRGITGGIVVVYLKKLKSNTDNKTEFLKQKGIYL
jgi:hypothetical protein